MSQFSLGFGCSNHYSCSDILPSSFSLERFEEVPKFINELTNRLFGLPKVTQGFANLRYIISQVFNETAPYNLIHYNSTQELNPIGNSDIHHKTKLQFVVQNSLDKTSSLSSFFFSCWEKTGFAKVVSEVSSHVGNCLMGGTPSYASFFVENSAPINLNELGALIRHTCLMTKDQELFCNEMEVDINEE